MKKFGIAAVDWGPIGVGGKELVSALNARDAAYKLVVDCGLDCRRESRPAVIRAEVLKLELRCGGGSPCAGASRRCLVEVAVRMLLFA